MSLYDTLQKTKKEFPYRFQRLQAEADAKRSEPVPYQEKDTQNSREVSRDQGIRDSYRQRVENDRNTALASMGNQGAPTGKTLIEKATGGLGQAGTIPQQKSVRQYLGLDPTEQQEETPKPKSTLELLEQQREENAKKITEGVLPEKQTASFLTWLDSKAGQVNRGVTKTIDVVANAIPMLEGTIMGENPDSTLTGQLLKPLTDATGKLDEWTARETENAAKLVDEAIGDNKALRLASDVGGGVITALPNAALAMMTGGASAGGTIGSQLAPQASGLAGTVSAAWQKLISNPMFQTSFIQGLGSGYEEAKEAGASDVNAMAAALLSTTANSIVEVGGGVETLPGELQNADLSTGKKALQWLTSALDEGKEEVVQGAISSMVNKAASGSDTPYFSMTDENAVVNPLRMGQEFGMGAAVGGILGGGQVLANSMLQNAYANRSGNGQDAATPSQAAPASPLGEGAQGDGMGKLDAAIQETMKPTQELNNLNNAIDGLFAQNETAQADTGAESTNVNTKAGAKQLTDTSRDAPVFTSENEFAKAPAASTVSQSEPSANGKSNMEQAVDALFPGLNGDVGDMGAKTSDFRHEVKESKSKTTPTYYEQNNVPEEGRSDSRYTVVHEDESLHNARLRLDQDYDGEIAEMRTKTTWSNEEVDMGQMVLDDLRTEAEKTGDWSKFREWNKVVSEHKSEIGRSMQALVKITRDTGSDIISNAAKMLENAKKGTDINDVMQTVSDYSDRFDSAVSSKSVSDLVSIIKDTAVTRKTKRHWGKKLGGEIDWALKRIADYADAEVRAAMNQEGDGNLQNYEFLRDFAAASIEDIAADQQKVSAGKIVLTIRRMSMLSKAATVMRNLVGNEGFDLVDTLARDISVPLDIILSKATGTRSVAFDRGALSKAGVKGQLDGLAKALLEVGLDVNAGGASSKYENSANRTFKMSGNVVSKLFSTWEKHMGYAMNVTDETKKGSVDARVQQGLDKLYEQGKIKDDSLRTGGQQEALYRTFQDKSALSDLSIDSRNLLNRFGKRIKLGNDDASLGDIAMPFAQVPANLADRAIDYSPVGLVESAVRLASVLKKAKNGTLKAAEQAQAVQNLGRNITGSTLIAIATGLALKGFIRVVNPFGEDENKDKAAFEKMQGQSGTQFNVSAFLRSQNGGSSDWQDGDTLVSIAFLEPFNAHLTIGAMLAEDMKAEGQITAKNIKDDTINGVWMSVLELPMFEKFRDAADAYTYSTKETPGEKLLDAANTLAANEVGSLIPNAWKGIAQGLDPYQRDLYSKDDVWGQAADQFRSVFDRGSLPIKQDSFGRDMMNEGGFLNFLNSNILPGQITTYKTDELLDKITDLSALTGKASVYPSRKAPDKITVDGEDVPLTQEKQRQYQSTYGQTEYDTRSALIGNSLYDNLTPQEELKAHGYAEDYAKQVSKSDVNADFEPDSWVEDLKGKTPAEVADAIMLKTFQSLAEDKKNYDSKYDGITDMLDSGTIDAAMAVSMLPKEASDGYYNYIQGSGVELGTYIDLYQFKNNAKSDKDKDGKTIKSAQEKVIEYINKVGKGIGQKRRMFLAMGYSEKNLPEEWK